MKALLFILLLLSLGVNAYFIWGKGIHVSHNYHQEQFQNQAQLVLTSVVREGKLHWLQAEPEDLTHFLNTLSPEQSLFAKVVHKRTVIYPEILPHTP